MNHLLPSLLVVTALVGTASPASARSPCDGRALPEGPLPVGFSQRDFGIVRGACPRTEVGLAIDGRATIENDNFYGNIRAAGRLDASVQPFEQLELFATVEPIAYQLVIQSFRDDYVGLGDSSLGATLLLFGRQRFALSLTGRATLPTALGYYAGSFPAAVEGGMLMLVEPIDPIRLHGGLLVGHRTAFTRASPDPRTAVIANAGVDVVIFDWLSFVVDLNGQALERGDLDLLAAAFGARFAVFKDFGIELGAHVPFAGDERALGAFLLRTSYRF